MLFGRNVAPAMYGAAPMMASSEAVQLVVEHAVVDGLQRPRVEAVRHAAAGKARVLEAGSAGGGGGNKGARREVRSA